MKLVLESPLSGDTERNRRYAAWCARVLRLNGHFVYASHEGCPHTLDDADPEERALGMAHTAAMTNNTFGHMHCIDFGTSPGMGWSREKFGKRHHFTMMLQIGCILTPRSKQCAAILLPTTGAQALLDAWAAFSRGEWPPCTKGFGPGRSVTP